ncbi:hypothetical protein CgunFtcFv8_022253 [Champsocephalus gunnari]|uniref:SEA domain-containing protein n=1 Tax=Champsocephalus gunnari TaxID=52237 RepID=A0AAN8DU59_CHAGU|nr:hypothetical protein CgunFtcFv8_022253 [Champsocephalus gunnari]
MQQTFTPQLANKSSPAFLELKNTVTTALDMVYSEQYGSSFNRTVINSFSQGSVVADCQHIFYFCNSCFGCNSSPNHSCSFNTTCQHHLTSSQHDFITSHHYFILSQPNFTISPPNFTFSQHDNNTSQHYFTISQLYITSQPNLTISQHYFTTSYNNALACEGTLDLLFSLSQTFTSDLSDSSSTAYKTLAETVISEVNNAAQKLYGSSFLRSIINTFTQGSVKVDMTLVFTNKTSTPTASDATSTFSTALSSSSLDVVQGSVSAQSTSTSSSPPRPTMGSLVVFSLTLLAVALTMTN